MQYNILVAVGHLELIQLVNKAIQDGWQPIGGVSASPLTHPDNADKQHVLLAQAVVK